MNSSSNLKKIGGKINFTDLTDILLRLINMKQIKNYYQKKPGSISSIITLNRDIRVKINKMI